MVNFPGEFAKSAKYVYRTAIVIFLIGFYIALFFAGFVFTSIRQEVWRQQALRAVLNAGFWQSYTENAQINEYPVLSEINQSSSTEPLKTQIHLQLRKNPLAQTLEADAPVSDGSRFRFQSFRNSDRLWIHNLADDQWYMTSPGNPEFQQLREWESPFSQWAQFLKDAQTAVKQEDRFYTRYIFQINGFRSGELNGYPLSPSSKGEIRITADAHGQLTELEAVIDFPDDLLLRSKRIQVHLEFSQIGATVPETLPSISRYQVLP